MSKIVCNIPHASTFIPEWANRDIVITATELSELVEFMVDKDVDKIWEFVPEQNKVVAKVSRIIADTERFADDLKEPMARRGMGMFYTHTPSGKLFRLKKGDAYLGALCLYTSYHKELEDKVAACLDKYNECIILDCHSFHDKMNYTNFDAASFPDVCIGVNGKITPQAEMIIKLFKENGYSVKVNEPFAGAMIPLKYLNDQRITSVMIELNRRIYDNASFEKVQAICRQIYEKLKI